jgi:hypothetical protein
VNFPSCALACGPNCTKLGQKRCLQGEKGRKFPLRHLQQTKIPLEDALLIAEFTLFPLAGVFLIAKIPLLPLAGALLSSEFSRSPLLDAEVPLEIALIYYTRDKKSRGRMNIFTICYKFDERSPS